MATFIKVSADEDNAVKLVNVDAVDEIDIDRAAGAITLTAGGRESVYREAEARRLFVALQRWTGMEMHAREVMVGSAGTR